MKIQGSMRARRVVFREVKNPGCCPEGREGDGAIVLVFVYFVGVVCVVCCRLVAVRRGLSSDVRRWLNG